MRHDELENVKHWDLRDAIVEVWGTQILFHSIRLKNSVNYFPRYRGGGEKRTPDLYKKKMGQPGQC